MAPMPRFPPVVLVLACLLFTAPAQAASSCLKLVFNQYCLGGDIQEQERRMPSPSYRQKEGDRYGLIYSEGNELIYVLSYKGRIYKVLRRYEGVPRQSFEEVEKLLAAKYGGAEEHGAFPSYAQSPGSRMGAILRGEGEAIKVWRPAGESWVIELRWSRQMGVNLAYLAPEFDAQQREQSLQGY